MTELSGEGAKPVGRPPSAVVGTLADKPAEIGTLAGKPTDEASEFFPPLTLRCRMAFPP